MFIIYLYLEVAKVLKALALLHFSYYQVALIRKWECRTWKICQIGVIDHWSAAKTEIWSEFSKTFIEYLFSSNLSFIFTKEVWSTILLLLESGAVHSFIHCTPSYSLITLPPFLYHYWPLRTSKPSNSIQTPSSIDVVSKYLSKAGPLSSTGSRSPDPIGGISHAHRLKNGKHKTKQCIVWEIFWAKHLFGTRHWSWCFVCFLCFPTLGG